MNKEAGSHETVEVDDELMSIVRSAIASAIAYEEAMPGRRQLGITGEIGKLLVCHTLGLRLLTDPRAKGFNALDKDGRRVWITARRSETEALPSSSGRVGTPRRDGFAWAVLALLDRQYELAEVHRGEHDDLCGIVENHSRPDLSISEFKSAAKRIL